MTKNPSRTAGYSGTPLAKKLGIKDGHRVGAVNAPDHLDEILAPLPDGASVVAVGSAERGGDEFHVILFFVRSEEALQASLASLLDRLDVDGGLWVGWPKQSSPLAGPLREGHVRSFGLSLGVVDNKICAIDPDWSGLRFVFRKENRAAIRADRQRGDDASD